MSRVAPASPHSVGDERAAFDPSVDVSFRPGRGGLDAFLVLPPDAAATAVPLVAVHGISRDAGGLAACLADRAMRTGRPVVAPLFDEARWRGYQRLATARRADLALLALMTELRAEGAIGPSPFDLFGFSGGAQFAHRFAMLYPHLPRLLSVCAAGWWTMPEAAPFPYGLSPGQGPGGDWGPRFAAGLDGFLALDIEVSVGALDDRPDASTRSRPRLDARQGRDRVSRAQAWTEALRTAASARGLPPRARLHLLPGCGHDAVACLTAGGLAARLLPHEGHSAAGETR